MEISKRGRGGYTVLDISGDLLSDTALQLEKEVGACAGDSLRLVIDLSKVPSIGSHALSLFIKLWKRVSSQQGTLYLVAGPRVHRKLEAMKIDRIIKIFETEKDWLDAIAHRHQESMLITVDAGHGFKIVRLQEPEERLDFGRELEKIFRDLLAAGHRELALDLTRVKHVYTDLLGVILSVGRKVRDQDGDFCIFGLNEDLLLLIKCVGMDHVVRIYRNEAEFNRAV